MKNLQTELKLPFNVLFALSFLNSLVWQTFHKSDKLCSSPWMLSHLSLGFFLLQALGKVVFPSSNLTWLVRQQFPTSTWHLLSEYPRILFACLAIIPSASEKDKARQSPSSFLLFLKKNIPDHVCTYLTRIKGKKINRGSCCPQRWILLV